MRFLLATLALLLVSIAPVFAQDDKIEDRLSQSATILEELLNAPDSDIPRDLIKNAECVAVIPAVKRAAFGFGGQYGRGAVACRKDQGKGPWGAPSMIGLSGGSFGFQLGGSSTDVVMLFMTPDSIKFLLRDKVTLGVDLSASAGPKGRAASAETSASMRAEILSYARSRGLFAGIALNGAVISPDKDANKNLYGREVKAEELLIQGGVGIPPAASGFISTLSKSTGS
jgi:lipid-binding SYLF domain-containing protein